MTGQHNQRDKCSKGKHSEETRAPHGSDHLLAVVSLQNLRYEPTRKSLNPFKHDKSDIGEKSRANTNVIARESRYLTILLKQGGLCCMHRQVGNGKIVATSTQILQLRHGRKRTRQFSKRVASEAKDSRWKQFLWHSQQRHKCWQFYQQVERGTRGRGLFFRYHRARPIKRKRSCAKTRKENGPAYWLKQSRWKENSPESTGQNWPKSIQTTAWLWRSYLSRRFLNWSRNANPGPGKVKYCQEFVRRWQERVCHT